MTGDPCVHCGDPATDTFLGSPICDGCIPGAAPDDEPTTESDRSTSAEPSGLLDNGTETRGGDGVEVAGSGANRPSPLNYVSKTQNWGATGGEWARADFTAPESGIWSPELLEREQWMGHVEKKPFAPWADRDHPEADADEDARWKWGLTENYVDGKTVAIAEDDPRLDGRAFLQQPDDPFAYVDGDDVRDPESGAVHPAFVAILEHLGLTYADVSQSGAGVHAIYRGKLPEDVKQAAWQLDTESWGANDDLPSIEIYPGKRVCVMTGEHVVGTPTEVREWNVDILEPLLEANDEVAARQRESIPTAREAYDLDDYEPEATTAAETTDDVRDIFAALDRLDARQVAAQTIVHRWTEGASTSDGKRAFVPTWGPKANGTANIVDSQIWQDTGDEAGYGGSVVMALIDTDGLSHRRASPRAASGSLWWSGVEHLRKLGFDIPEYESSVGTGADRDLQAVSALPLKQLDALPPQDRRRHARKRGLDWPSTDAARERLFETIADVMRNEDDRVVDAPTALGKSYTVAATRWGAREDITGDRPVVHLLENCDARDEAIEVAKREGGAYHVLLGRHDACPVAAGEHDAEVTIDGEPASDWLDGVCGSAGKGMPFSAAHRYLAEHHDRGGELPCCEEGMCYALEQWDVYREGPEDSREEWPLVIATHNFAFAPGLRSHANVVLDEEPTFTSELTTEGVRRAVAAYLREVDAPVTTWESFVHLSQYDGYASDAATERDAVDAALNREPDRDWYFECSDAHILAPALARAIFRAADRANDRRVGKTVYQPPRLDANARDDDDWNREWVTVVLNDANDVEHVRVVPDFGAARSVVGLDAHPAEPVWQANTVPWIESTPVLEPEERRLWRRYERGLRVVQVGDATRPLSGSTEKALEWLGDERLSVLFEHLADEYGTQFRTAITTAQVEDRVEELMADAGCHQPALMHFGEEKSRNDFAHERIGLVNGCMDPGDDYVVNLLAELDLQAEVETSVDEDGEEYRAHGRGFVGEDAETAAEILASVRENHTAQAAGRYARNADDPTSSATVFVRTDAIPQGFADVEVPGVEWVFTDLQRDIVDELRDSTQSRSVRELADAVGCTKEHVRQMLKRLAADEYGAPAVQLVEGGGPNGATLYSGSGLPHAGVCDVSESPTNPYTTPSTWALAIRDANRARGPPPTPDTPAVDGSSGAWAWRTAVNGGDPPPDEAE